MLPCFTYWHNLFYVDKKKIIPLDLYNLLDYEALAYWIMGDGTKSGTGLTLQTQSFTVKECVFIISILMYKFNLKLVFRCKEINLLFIFIVNLLNKLNQIYCIIFLFLWDISYKSIKIKVFCCFFNHIIWSGKLERPLIMRISNYNENIVELCQCIGNFHCKSVEARRHMTF